ncbi:MAG TPA: hypothetical protein VF677_14565 [Flavobacterium sp.]|jgi:hypothetical protein
MKSISFDPLKNSVQEIIDLIAQHQNKEANAKLTDVSELIDELIDNAESDEDLIEISRYQVMLNHLHQKINAAE